MTIDLNKYKIDPKKVTKEDMDEALKLLEKSKIRQARIAAGELKGTTGVSYKDMTPEQKTQVRKYARRRQIRINLLVKKAEAAGITVTDREVDEAMVAS